MIGLAKFITLYVLLLGSAIGIALTLDTHWLAALGSAVFVTVVVHAHVWIGSKWQQQPANVNEYDVELVPFPCPQQAEAA